MKHPHLSLMFNIIYMCDDFMRRICAPLKNQIYFFCFFYCLDGIVVVAALEVSGSILGSDQVFV